MRAGRLRHRFTIESPPDPEGAVNAHGEPSGAAATVGNVYGSLEYIAGRELWYGQQVAAQATHGVQLRYRDDLTPRHRLLLGERIFAIESVGDPTGRKRELLVQVKEKTGVIA